MADKYKHRIANFILEVYSLYIKCKLCIDGGYSREDQESCDSRIEIQAERRQIPNVW